MKIEMIQVALVAMSLINASSCFAAGEVNGSSADAVSKSALSTSRLISDRLLPLPVDFATYEYAVLQSDWVGLCEYRGYTEQAHIGFYRPPVAKFHVIKRLIGPVLATELPINFSFYDDSSSKMPEGWKFGPDKMPEIGSKWIVFVYKATLVPESIQTYKGSWGRQPATEENVSKLEAIIKGQTPHFLSPQSNSIQDDSTKRDLAQIKVVETEEECSALIEKSPNNAGLHFNYALLLERAGKKDKALAEFKKAAALDPSNVDYLGTYGQMLIFKARFDNPGLGQMNLMRAAQMPGGEKYQALYDVDRKYLQAAFHCTLGPRQATTPAVNSSK